MSITLAQWQSAWPVVAATAVTLPALGVLLSQRLRHQQQQARATALTTLDYLLTLMQRLQRHRALGGRSDSEATQQRLHQASELDRLWESWAEHFPEATHLPSDWSLLKRNASDFDAHCLLIDRLLGAIELVERRANTRNRALGPRCRTIEELGQLRGLSVRAAALPRCPVQLEVPIRYLCLRLNEAGPEISNALREIELRLLTRRGSPMTPADCFALLTPLIDRALEQVRTQLHAQVDRRRDVAPLRVTLLNHAATER